MTNYHIFTLSPRVLSPYVSDERVPGRKLRMLSFAHLSPVQTSFLHGPCPKKMSGSKATFWVTDLPYGLCFSMLYHSEKPPSLEVVVVCNALAEGKLSAKRLGNQADCTVLGIANESCMFNSLCSEQFLRVFIFNSGKKMQIIPSK